MKCRNCGQEIDLNWTECPNCGQKNNLKKGLVAGASAAALGATVVGGAALKNHLNDNSMPNNNQNIDVDTPLGQDEIINNDNISNENEEIFQEIVEEDTEIIPDENIDDSANNDSLEIENDVINNNDISDENKNPSDTPNDKDEKPGDSTEEEKEEPSDTPNDEDEKPSDSTEEEKEEPGDTPNDEDEKPGDSTEEEKEEPSDTPNDEDEKLGYVNNEKVNNNVTLESGSSSSIVFENEDYSDYENPNNAQQQAVNLQQDIAIDEFSLVAAVNKINSFDPSSVVSGVNSIISSLGSYDRLRKYYSNDPQWSWFNDGVNAFLSSEGFFYSKKSELNNLLQKTRELNPVFDEYVGIMFANDKFGDDAFELQKKLQDIGATDEDVISIYEELSAYASNSTINNLKNLEMEDYNYKESLLYDVGESKEKVKQDYLDYAMKISKGLFMGLNLGLYDNLDVSQREINNYTIKSCLDKDYSNRNNDEKAIVKEIYLYGMSLSDDEVNDSDRETYNLITTDYKNVYSTSDYTDEVETIIEKAAYIASFDKDGHFKSFEDVTISEDEKEIIIPARSKHGNELFDFFTEITGNKDIRERSMLAEYIYLNHELHDIERVQLNNATDELYSITGTNENGKVISMVDETERDTIIDFFNQSADDYHKKIDDLIIFNHLVDYQDEDGIDDMELYYQYREGTKTADSFQHKINHLNDSLVSNDIAKGEKYIFAEQMRSYHQNLLINEENELLNLNKKNKNDLKGQQLSLTNAYDWEKIQVEINEYDDKIKENEEKIQLLNEKSISIKENINDLYFANLFKYEQMSDFTDNVVFKISDFSLEEKKTTKIR